MQSPSIEFAREQAEAVVTRAVDRYVLTRRLLIPTFVDRHFGLRGSLRMHRRAFGRDILRAPANVVLAIPALAAHATGAGLKKAGAGRAGAWLSGRRILLETDVAKEVAWLIQTEFLELPTEQKGRRFERDALAEAIFADETVEQALAPVLAEIGSHADDHAFRSKLRDVLGAYTTSRMAASELTANLVSMGTGVLAYQKFTPGALSLGPTVAGALAQSVAVAGFPLGSSMGALWYGVFPATASPLLVAGATGGILGVAAVFAAFAGVVADPIQKSLGLHQRRLEKLVETLERNLKGESEARLVVYDHYVVRLLDVFDIARAALRVIP